MTSAAEPAMGTAGAKSESRPRDVIDELRAAYRAADKKHNEKKMPAKRRRVQGP